MVDQYPLIIGLSGKSGSGKSWLAEYAEHNYGFLVMSFAGPLKADLVRLGFDSALVYSHKPPHIRKLLQAYGMAARKEDPNWWVKRLFNNIDMLYDGEHRIIIDDVRFENEVDAIRAAGGYVYRMINVDASPVYSGFEDESETALDNYEGFDGYFVAGAGQVELLAKQFKDEATSR